MLGWCVCLFLTVPSDAPAPSAPLAPTLKPQPAAQSVEEVPDSEKSARARQAIGRMRDVLGRTLKHLEEARNERDVVKLNCVNEKLTAIKGLLRISEQADVALQEALAKRNSEAAAHEFEKISIASRKIEQLFGEAEACVGELAVYAGETQVEVATEGVPEGEPADRISSVEIITRPPAASPYM